jgi:acetyl-CoA synthetase
MSQSSADLAWVPTDEVIAAANVTHACRLRGLSSYDELYRWSIEERPAFWEFVAQRLGIRFCRPYSRVLDLSAGVESPEWFVDGTLNLVESCFQAPGEQVAIRYQKVSGRLREISYHDLNALVDRVAHAFGEQGLVPGDAVAIVMPMTLEAVAIYLGVIKAGGVVVSIADSFQPPEIATRLALGQARAVFTQDRAVRAGKRLPLYETVGAANPPRTVVVRENKESSAVALRAGDLDWSDWLSHSSVPFPAVPRRPGDTINILFSSGTTGEPKAIPWTQTTPIKAAMDAHFHQNVQAGDVLVWPTNLGWMMGPWLIFASLINRATIGLFYEAPTGRLFGQFVQDAGVTMLGVVPSLVKTWRASRCMEGLDWSKLKAFSSTGECSSADDMRYLMTLAPGRPVIEYCGGTELGGGYLTSVVTLPCPAGLFNTPALGTEFVILDEAGRPSDNGELFLIPPSLGFSTRLINGDHHEVYFAGAPSGPPMLRRHGDQVERLPDGFYRAHGRVDDTMNLGGIKVSSAEIERIALVCAGVREAAAVAVPPPDGGPSLLVLFVVAGPAAREELRRELQQLLKRRLNPLFKIHDVVVVDALPRTASNKVMRRLLRTQYHFA